MRRLHGLVLGACLGGALWFCYDFFYPKKPITLNAGTPIAKAFFGKEVHCYQIDVEKGQFIHLELVQNEIDLEMTLRDPGGQILSYRDSSQGSVGVEVMSIIATQTGVFQLEITAYEETDKGHYQLALDGPRRPVERDVHQAAASEAFYRAGLKKGSDQKQIKQKVAAFLEAAKIWSQAGDSLQMAVAYLEAGRVHRSIDLKESLSYFSKSENLLARLNYPKVRALVFREMAYVAFYLEMAEEMIAYHQAGLKLLSETDRDRAFALHGLGVAYRFTGQYRSAHEAYAEAKLILDEVGDQESWRIWNDGFGSLLLKEKRAEEAMPYLEKALELSEDREGENFRGLLTRLAETADGMDHYEEALKYHRWGLGLLKRQDDENWPDMNYYYALTLFNMGDSEQALALLKQVEARFAELDKDDRHFNALYQLAIVEQAMGFCTEAQDHIEQALNILARQRQVTRSTVINRFSLSIRYEPIELWAELVLGTDGCNLDGKERYWERLDRLRSASLVETLQLAKAKKSREMLKVEKQITQFLLDRERGSRDETMVDELSLDDLRRYYAQLFNQRAVSLEKDPLIKPLEFEEMLALVSGDHKLLLYYVMGKTNAYVLTFQDGDIQSFNLGNRAELELDITNYLDQVRTGENLRLGKDIRITARRLGRLFPKELLDRQKHRHLIIVTDSNLHELPFAALPFGPDHAYLGTQFKISHIPSLATLAAIKRQERQATEEMIVFADPLQPDNEKDPLPYARREAEMIAGFFPSASLYLGAEASLANAMSGVLRSYSHIHVGTHGILVPESGDLSALLLTGLDEQGNIQKEYLRASMIATLELNARLVVLAACETGLGEHLRGEGLVGLPQAFLTSGAASVVVSLWEVKDKGTSVFMTHFYEHLRTEGHLPVDALHHAQKKMAQDKTFGDPHYWAGFRLIGDSDPE